MATKLAARPRVPTTGASLRGQSPPPCRSRPEIVAPALRYFETLKLRENYPYGFKATFNATIAERSLPPQLWVSPFHFGINQGPVVLMIENFRTGLIWNLMRRCPYLVAGLDKAGFAGGWLGRA